MDGINALCDRVREAAYALHVYLGPGHFESVYETGLVHRLRKSGLRVEQQVHMRVLDEDATVLGTCVPDLLIEGVLVAEIKAASRLSAEHAAQVMGYLRAARLGHALLINFGGVNFEIRKYARTLAESCA